VNSSWAKALENLPRPIKRRSYLRHLRFHAGELRDLTFKLAETAQEREQAFRVLHDMYVRRGLLDPSSSGLKLTVFSLLPTTAIFIGIRDGRVLSTMSLVEDSPLGLPMEDLYADAVEKVRTRGGRLAEVGALAVARGARGKGLALQMYNLMFRWAHFHRSVDDLVIAVHPRVRDFYETLLLFDKIGGERRYSTLKDAPAVALRLDLRTAVARYRKIYDSRADVSEASNPGRNFYRFFCVEEYGNLRLPARPIGGALAPVPAFPPSQADAFLEREPIDIGSLTPEQRKYLLRQLPKLKSLSLVEVDFTSRPRSESAAATPEERLRALVAAATRAPSADNTQPWHFEIDPAGRIDVFLDEARDSSPMNAGQRLARIGVGAAIENLVRAAARSGFAADVEEAEGARVASVHLKARTSSVEPIEAAMAARSTNRRVYEGRALPPTVLARLLEDTGTQDRVLTEWVDRTRLPAIASLLARADATAVSQPAIREAFFSRVRFDVPRGEPAASGLSIDSLELSLPQRLALRMMPRAPNWLFQFGATLRGYTAHVQRLVESASGLCLVIAPDATEGSDVAVGRAVERAWLALTAQGLAVQPMMSLLILQNILEQGSSTAMSSRTRARTVALSRELQELLPEIGPGRAAFLMRFGYAAAPSGRSGRRDVAEVSTVVTAPEAAQIRAGDAAPARNSARRRRILFIAEGVSLCHAARPTALAEALSTDDYEVVLAREPRFSEIGSQSGIAVRPIHSISSDRFLEALASGSPLYDVETLDSYVREDLEVIADVAPDAVIGDFRLSLSVSARLAGVPYLALCDPCWSPYARIRFPLADHRWSRIVGSATAQAVFSAVRPLALAYHCRPLNAVRQRYGLSSLGRDLRRVYTDADHTLYADAPGLIPLEGMPSNHHHLGPISDSPATAWPGWWNAVPADRPVVSLTLAFARGDLFSMALEALADLPVTVLVTTGGRRDFASLPANAFFADYLPAQAVAARSSLAIGDGGTWTCQPPLAAGVPVLGIAGNMNQTINMQAIQRRGAGEMLRASTADPASLRAMVQRMLADPAYTSAAQEIARLYAQHHAPTRLAEILEMVFANSRAVA
jgi:UDP:flavonoid glycosyltransferase YjiC (YdhE family)